MKLRRWFGLLAVLIACCLLFATSAAGRFPALEMPKSGDDDGWSDMPGTNTQWQPPEHCDGAEQLDGSPPESDSSPEDGSDSLSITDWTGSTHDRAMSRGPKKGG